MNDKERLDEAAGDFVVRVLTREFKSTTASHERLALTMFPATYTDTYGEKMSRESVRRSIIMEFEVVLRRNHGYEKPGDRWGDICAKYGPEVDAWMDENIELVAEAVLASQEGSGDV